MATERDVVENASLTLTAAGMELARVFIVSNLAGSAPIKMANALNAASIPRLNDSHPGIPDILVTQIEVETLGAKTMRVIATYSLPNAEELEADESQPPQIQVTTSVRTDERTKDIHGNEIFVVHVFQDDDGAGNITPRTETRVVPVTVQVPQPVLRLSRREPESPFPKSQEFVGSVNSISWKGQQPRTWLCVHIDGVTDDGGLSYQVSYEFQYNSNTWDATVYFTDSDGRPVADLVEGLGIRAFEVYPLKDFNSLLL